MKTPARKAQGLQTINTLLYIGILSILPLMGCAVYGGPDAPRAAVPENWLNAPESTATAIPGQWWAEFNDPNLNQLIARALEHAPDRRLALSRITEARAMARNSAAQLAPKIDLAATTARNKNGSDGAENDFAAGFDASWELDLFGKNLQQTYAANASRDAIIADEKEVTLSLIAEIARQYTLHHLYTQQAVLAESTAQAQQGILKVTEARYKQGVESNLELMRARTLQQTTSAQGPLYRNLAQTAAFQLDYLIGDMPGANAQTLSKSNIIPLLDRDVLLDVPATIIQNRPDIKAAEERVIAATALKRSAIAEIYPTISVSGLLGISSDSVGGLFNGGNNTWSAGGTLLAPLFHFGRIRTNIVSAGAREDQAIIQFEQTVLGALRDIETAAQAYQKSVERHAILASALESSKNAVSIARKQYTEGILSQLDVLQAEQTAFSTEEAAVQATSDLTLSFIALCKALALQPENK